MSFNFLKTPFQRLSVENQQEIKGDVKATKEYFTDKSKNTIVHGISNLIKEVQKIGSSIKELSNKIDKSIENRFDKKELKDAGQASVILGRGLLLIIKAIETYSKLPNEVIDKFLIGITKISEKFARIAKNLGKFITAGKSLQEIAKGILFFGLSLLISGPIYLMAMPLAPIVIGVILGIGYIFSNYLANRRTLKNIKIAGRALTYMALGILAFGISLFISGQLYAMSVKYLPLVLAAVLGTTFLLSTVLGSRKIRKNILTGIYALTLMSGAILAFGISLFISGPLYAMGVKYLPLVLAVVLGTTFLLSTVLGSRKIRKNILTGIYALTLMSGAILAFGISLLISGKIMSHLIENDTSGLFVLAAVLLGITTIMGFISNMKKRILEGSLAMLIMTVSIAVLGGALWLFSRIFPATKQNWENIALISTVIGALAISLLIVGSAKQNVVLGALALIIASVSIIVLGFALKTFTKAISSGYGWEQFGLLAGTVAGLAAEFALIGIPVVAGIIALGSLAIMAISASIIGLSHALNKWRSVGFKESDASDLQKAIVRIPMAFLGLSGDEGFVGAIKTAAKTTATMAAATVNAAMMIVLSTSLGVIGMGLSSFKKTKFSPSDAEDIRSVISTLSNVFANIGRKHGGSGLFGLGGGDVYKGIHSIMGMGNAIETIATGMQHMADLKFPVFDKDGKIKSYFTVKDDAMSNVTDNIGYMVESLSTVFSKIGSKDKSSWWASSDIEKGIDSVKDIGSPIANLALGLQGMADLRFPDKFDQNGKPISYINLNKGSGVMDQVTENIGSMITSLGESYRIVGSKDKSILWASSDIEKGIDAVRGIGDPISGLAEGLINMAKLKFPVEYDKNGKPTKFLDLNKAGEAGKGGVFDNVTGNIKKMIISLSSVFKEIGEDDDSGWFSSSTIEKGIEMATSMGEPLGKLSDLIDNFSKLKDKDLSIANTFNSIDKVINSFLKPFSIKTNPNIEEQLNNFTVFTRDVGRLSETSSELKDIDKSFSGIAESMSSFKNDMNGLNMEQLKEVRGLFEAMAVISQSGTAEDVMRKYGDALNETFENLADILENFGSKVKENTDTVVQTQEVQSQSQISLFESIKKKQEAVEAAPSIDTSQNDKLVVQLDEIANILRGTIKVKNTENSFI